jgi:hypothetical protein
MSSSKLRPRALKGSGRWSLDTAQIVFMAFCRPDDTQTAVRCAEHPDHDPGDTATEVSGFPNWEPMTGNWLDAECITFS